MSSIFYALIDWGYIGMFISAFLSGSFLPFASEAVFASYVYMGLNPVLLLILATIGNSLGGATCYGIGYLGKIEWIEKYLRIKREKIRKTQKFVHKWGPWIAFFSFVPGVGDVIIVILGLMRADFRVVLFSMTLGKMLRYTILLGGILGLLSFGH